MWGNCKVKTSKERIAVLEAENEVLKAKLEFQNTEKQERAEELLIANKELVFQNEEKSKRAEELIATNKELYSKSIEREERLLEIASINAKLFFEKQIFEKTLISIGDGVISTDANQNITFMNKISESLTGWTLEDAFGKPIYSIFNIMNEYTRTNDEDIINKVILSKSIHHIANHTILITKEGTEKLIEDSAAPILDIENNVVGVVIVFRDYSEKWERLKQIQYVNLHDDLTGLYNRRFFEVELLRLDESQNLPLSIIMGDVNGLKLINDSFGHHLGDEMLLKTAESLKEGCRKNEIIARLGGDEFVLILPNCDKNEAAKVIQRIKTSLVKKRVNNMEISISFGHATKTLLTEDIEKILRKSEDSMYRHKLYESSSMRSRTISLISNTLFEKSAREQVHCERVSSLSVKLSEKLGLNDEEVKVIRIIGLMHDIGKIGVEDEILNKTSRLTEEEYIKIRKHPEIGARILSSVLEFADISSSVLQHHERWDGTGYPQGLKGTSITIEARIIALADAFDAMTSQRTYCKQKTTKEAIQEINRNSGTQFDPILSKMFIEMIIENPLI
jgi:diguanylate cyclase